MLVYKQADLYTYRCREIIVRGFLRQLYNTGQCTTRQDYLSIFHSFLEFETFVFISLKRRFIFWGCIWFALCGYSLHYTSQGFGSTWLHDILLLFLQPKCHMMHDMLDDLFTFLNLTCIPVLQVNYSID